MTASGSISPTTTCCCSNPFQLSIKILNVFKLQSILNQMPSTKWVNLSVEFHHGNALESMYLHPSSIEGRKDIRRGQESCIVGI